jgi:exodeoxyribonuclease VIII
VIKENHPSELYHADKETISKHGLDLIHKAPLVYKHGLTAQKKQTPAMRWGEIVHSYILEFEKFLDEYVIEPEGLDKRTKEGKAWSEEAKQQGLRAVSHDEHETLKQMYYSIVSNEAARELMHSAQLIEPSVYWEEDGSKCRARPDLVTKHSIVDLKTTSNIRNFAKDAANFRYHVQAAFYLSGLRHNGLDPSSFQFIAVETEPPFLCQVFLSDDFFLARGADEYKKDLETYVRCKEMNEWPGLPEQSDLSLPAWAH